VSIIDEKTERHSTAGLALDEEITQEQSRSEAEYEQAGKRIRDFREVEKGFTKDQAHREAKRCLRCDLEKEMVKK